ncbi:Common pilus major fimbrillin subunit EcpA [Klebsiella spallanzanii]|uniref:Common pilus major fimbrillin subunit EcpA n=1 Tax=Klebsiella spallanzanii TaxID=2587528 RepID=A0ABY6VF22_9ENTR|nr:common pilus major fimbrillin subunit EcpA [Klebsiella spallanzanii]VUS67380.1 Common pilus major fimbrillin subunit EcpA [Klebsiella spallanzanii]
MKKSLLAACATSILFCSGAMAADVEASATASWDASATKDTTSLLVVTPLRSVSFEYAEGLKAFNSQDGAFDITIQGQENASDFVLTSQLVTNTLNRAADGSTLEVGVAWNGEKLSKTAPVTMIDISNKVINTSSGLESLAAGYDNNADRTSTQSAFLFTIDSATSDGLTATPFASLADGYWNGDVKVQFTAEWTL